MCLMFFGLDKNSADNHVSSAILCRVLRFLQAKIVLKLCPSKLFYSLDHLFVIFINTDCIHSFCNVFLSVLLYYPNFHVINVLKKA